MMDEIEDAKEAWRAAEILDRSPSWEGQPVHSHWVERLADSADAAIDSQLLDIATNEVNLVAAYAIETLARRDSELLNALPEDVLNRPGMLTCQTGSFRERMQFKDFVRSALRRAKRKKAETLWLRLEAVGRLLDHLRFEREASCLVQAVGYPARTGPIHNHWHSNENELRHDAHTLPRARRP